MLPGMIRKAFVMSVNPGCEEEYRRRHNPIWPELEGVLRGHGVRTYSIFLHGDTRQLFAYVECEDEERWESIAASPVCRRWWEQMRELMPASGPDHRPDSVVLQEVFHLGPGPDGSAGN